MLPFKRSEITSQSIFRTLDFCITSGLSCLQLHPSLHIHTQNTHEHNSSCKIVLHKSHYFIHKQPNLTLHEKSVVPEGSVIS